MKTERRHELQTNDLADWIGQRAERIKPYVKALLGAVILVVALIVAGMWYSAERRRQNERSWTEYFAADMARDPTGLREIAKSYPKTTAAARALQAAADIDLASGADELYRDQAEAKETLRKARDDYRAVLEMAQDQMLRTRALMGLAQAYEALDEFDQAKQQYEQVQSGYPETAVAELARQRLRLEQPATQEFYHWFLEQETRSSRIPGGDGLSVKPPSIYDDLPTAEGLSLPDRSELRRPDDRSEFGPMSPPESATDMPFLNLQTESGDRKTTEVDEDRASQFPTESDAAPALIEGTQDDIPSADAQESWETEQVTEPETPAGSDGGPDADSEPSGEPPPLDADPETEAAEGAVEAGAEAESGSP